MCASGCLCMYGGRKDTAIITYTVQGCLTVAFIAFLRTKGEPSWSLIQILCKSIKNYHSGELRYQMKDQSIHNTTTTTCHIKRTQEFIKSFLRLLNLSDAEWKKDWWRLKWNLGFQCVLWMSCGEFHTQQEFPCRTLSYHDNLINITHTLRLLPVYHFQIRGCVCWTLQDQYKGTQKRLFIHKYKQKSVLVRRILTLLSPQSFTKSKSITDKM